MDLTTFKNKYQSYIDKGILKITNMHPNNIEFIKLTNCSDIIHKEPYIYIIVDRFNKDSKEFMCDLTKEFISISAAIRNMKFEKTNGIGVYKKHIDHFPNLNTLINNNIIEIY